MGWVASGSKSVPVKPLSDAITERDSTKTVTGAEERVIDTSSPRLQRKDDNVTAQFYGRPVQREMGFLPRVKERASFCENLQKEQPSSRAHNLLILSLFTLK